MADIKELQATALTALNTATEAATTFDELRASGSAEDIVKAAQAVTSTKRASEKAAFEVNTFELVGIYEGIKEQTLKAAEKWDFKTLLGYSPLHNVREGTRYPATIIATADTDDRVVPLHSFKYGAALQHAQAGDAPILLRVESRAGHGMGMPTSKAIDQTADLWSFLVRNLEVTL